MSDAIVFVSIRCNTDIKVHESASNTHALLPASTSPASCRLILASTPARSTKSLLRECPGRCPEVSIVIEKGIGVEFAISCQFCKSSSTAKRRRFPGLLDINRLFQFAGAEALSIQAVFDYGTQTTHRIRPSESRVPESLEPLGYPVRKHSAGVSSLLIFVACGWVANHSRLSFKLSPANCTTSVGAVGRELFGA